MIPTHIGGFVRTERLDEADFSLADMILVSIHDPQLLVQATAGRKQSEITLAVKLLLHYDSSRAGMLRKLYDAIDVRRRRGIPSAIGEIVLAHPDEHDPAIVEWIRNHR